MDRGKEIELAANSIIDDLNGLEGFDRTDMINMFGSGITWAEEHPKNPWISVKDRLPEESGWVFVAGGRNPYRALLYCAGLFYSDITLGTFDSGVTHWMPIPKFNE